MQKKFVFIVDFDNISWIYNLPIGNDLSKEELYSYFSKDQSGVINWTPN